MSDAVPDNIRKQTERAYNLADALDDCGPTLTGLDILDCLAITGFRLEEDEEGLASTAYFSVIRRMQDANDKTA